MAALMSTLTKDSGEELAHRGRGRPRDEVVRGRILSAALAVLEDLGFANATNDAIAERAGASKATIYRWWPNKAAVLMEALSEAITQELPFPDTGNLRDDLRLQLRNFIKLLTGRRGRVFKAFVAAAQTDLDVSEAFRSVWVQPRRANAKAILERYRNDDMREGVDLDLVMDCLYGPLYYHVMVRHAPISEEYADALADLIFDAIKKRDCK